MTVLLYPWIRDGVGSCNAGVCMSYHRSCYMLFGIGQCLLYCPNFLPSLDGFVLSRINHNY